MAIQLKRKKQTFFVTVKSNANANAITKELHSIIQSIGGLDNGEDDLNENENGEEEIDIPVPSFETMDSDDEVTQDSKMNDIKSAKTKYVPDLENIVLGVPRDDKDPYGSGFTKIKDLKKSLELSDFSILAFKFLEEDEFEVIEPIDADE